MRLIAKETIVGDLTETDRVIRESGLRRTTPRAVVAHALRSNPGHHTVGDIQMIVDRDFSEVAGMARSSLYRAIEALEGAGLVHALRTSQEEVRYEWIEHAHHHLICTGCGSTEEIALPSIQQVEKEIAREHRFTTEVRHLALKGECRSCARRSGAQAPKPASSQTSRSRDAAKERRS